MRWTVYTSAARMKLPVDASQIFAINVRVDLRGRDVRVPEHVLHGTQVGATLEQMGGERVPQGVRRDAGADPRRGYVFPQDLPGTHSGERRAACVEQQCALPSPCSSFGRSSRR